jgi:hypothetical protein
MRNILNSYKKNLYEISTPQPIFDKCSVVFWWPRLWQNSSLLLSPWQAKITHKAWVCHTAVLSTKLAVL